jgi:hypothetical protein
VDNTIREKALAATFLTVDQQHINPWLISADLTTPSSSSSVVELRLGIAVLVCEMQQCDVQVDERSLLDFVKEDIKKHKCTALDGYLMVARAIISPRPTRKSDGWFARVFTSPPKWVPPVPRWKWKSVTSVEVIDDEVLVIKGGCVESS